MIILASASPARSQLLTQWGIQHQVIPTHLDEDKFKARISDPKTLVETLAHAKTTACLRHLRGGQMDSSDGEFTILAADTIVVLDNQIIGKPTDRNDAKRIIELLQGKTHQVWTGVCLLKPPRLNRPQAEKISEVLFSDTASVTFKPMTKTEIKTYLDSNDWVGAAGAYRIQHAIKPYIEAIHGEINTVIGLPKTVVNYCLESEYSVSR